ncbi:hypothetical protein EI555_020552, partial [Monodon monoceros]
DSQIDAWGTAAATKVPTGGFGAFGTTSTTAGSAFSFSAPDNTNITGLFGGTQNKVLDLVLVLAQQLELVWFRLGFGGFNTQQKWQQQTTLGVLFIQPTKAPAQFKQLINAASALSVPAFWGTEKGNFNNNIPPTEFKQENPFCWFKAVGYSCMPNNKHEDGLVVLVFNKKETDIQSQQQQLVESLHKILGGNQTLTVNVEGIKALSDDQTEVVIYVVERSPNGTSRRVPATIIYAHFEQTNIKAQLQQLCIEQLLQNPPADVDPIIWEQVKVDNLDSENLIPVPMVQDQMTKQHQTRLDIISEDIVNELMSQIRRQNHFGAVKSEERYYIDTDLLQEIKRHLKQQQEDLSHLISIIKDDLEDKLVEHGLNETIDIREYQPNCNNLRHVEVIPVHQLTSECHIYRIQ